LSAFQRSLPEFEQLDARVIGISADTAEEAQKTVDRHRIAFPVLYGASPALVAKSFGTHTATNANGTYINSTGFIVDPRGAVAIAVYSSGAIGRIVADDAIGIIKYNQSRVGAKVS
jgi:peroxiredoxin